MPTFRHLDAIGPTRRQLLTGLGAGAAGVMLGGCVDTHIRLGADPFTLGVASGEPAPDSVVLWTRLALDPIHGGGMPAVAVPVGWIIAEDERLTRNVRSGTAVAEPADAHSVHVEVCGLSPDRWYFYRFRTRDAQSPLGRTRTAPAPGAPLARLRFGFGSCQQYEHGYFTAYADLVAQAPDLFVHLGDYIYELSWGERRVRDHGAPEADDLTAYRNRYGLYKSDPDLQAAHAACPWLFTWDDHEVDNDYANDRSEELTPRDEFLRRRAAAYKAYWEHMPLPPALRPTGPDMQIYRHANFGDLVEMVLLDDRQYRSPQPCPKPGRGGGNVVEGCAERLDPSLTMLGPAQERWLFDRLAGTRARWTVIAQQTLMAELDRKPGPGAAFATDSWDGYPAARQRLLTHIEQAKPANPVVIGGDVHAFFATDLKTDFADRRAPAVATEFVGGSITSNGAAQSRTESWRPDNPHIRFANSAKRGYGLVDARRAAMTVEFRAVDDVKRPGTPVRTLARFVVPDGRPGAETA
jgi:alkaline phosphatase D